MALSVLIDAVPQLCFYDTVKPNGAPALSYARLLSVPTVYAESPVGGGGENANGQIVINNGDGALTSLFAIPPLGATITITSDSETLLAGTISRLSLNSDLRITIEG